MGVSGNAIIVDASLKTSIVNFAVDQECMCSCSTEAHGIFCLGASDSNMFTVIAFKEEGSWIMEQHSVNASVGGFNYHATLRLGTSPAGSARSASGYALTGVGAVETTQFHATHSATGAPSASVHRLASGLARSSASVPPNCRRSVVSELPTQR